MSAKNKKNNNNNNNEASLRTAITYVTRGQKLYYSNKLKQCNGNQHKIWKVINDVLERDIKDDTQSQELVFDNITYTDKQEISKAFNNFYKEVATKITNNIPKSKKSSEFYLNQASNDRFELPFHLKKVNETEVFNIIRNLNNKSSKGPDGFSNKIVRETAEFYISDLTKCINKSLHEATFPEMLKLSKISPLFKKK